MNRQKSCRKVREVKVEGCEGMSRGSQEASVEGWDRGNVLLVPGAHRVRMKEKWPKVIEKERAGGDVT